MPDAFVMRHDNVVGRIFATAFLASPEFDKETLGIIAGQLDVGGSRSSRDQLIDRITPIFSTSNFENAAKIVIEKLVSRRRDWVSVRTGVVRCFPKLASAEELVWASGTDKWYGPVRCYADVEDAVWYLRPVFIDHWEVSETDTTRLRKVTIRWLCFARATQDTLSLHWRGFSYIPNQQDVAPDNEVARASQFPYWNHIPDLFAEIGIITEARVDDINLHDLILYTIWDKYRGKAPYKWKDTRIRAESSGVSLNAHAAGIKEINPTGILHLATTVRKAVQNEVKSSYNMDLPDPDQLDNVILRTLIREYGALSYGFRLENVAGSIFEAHSYFGNKPSFNSPESVLGKSLDFA